MTDTPKDIEKANEEADLFVAMIETDEGFKQLGEEAYRQAQRQNIGLNG